MNHLKLAARIYDILSTEGYITNSRIRKMAHFQPKLRRAATEELIARGYAYEIPGTGLKYKPPLDSTRKTIRIGGKSVFVSEPYTPSAASCMAGRRQELSLLVSAWGINSQRLPLCPILVGDAGVGKNRLVYEASIVTRKPLYMINANEGITPDDLTCFVRPCDNIPGSFDYILSPLVSAMIAGGIFFLDEIGKLNPKSLAALAGLLDERRYMESTLLGERIAAHPGFRFVAATNRSDLDEYSLPDYITSRLKPVIRFGYPLRDELLSMLMKNPFFNRPETIPMFDVFMNLAGNRGIKVSPRDAINTFAMAANIADFEHAAGNEGKNTGNGSIETRHLVESFSCTFGKE